MLKVFLARKYTFLVGNFGFPEPLLDFTTWYRKRTVFFEDGLWTFMQIYIVTLYYTMDIHIWGAFCSGKRCIFQICSDWVRVTTYLAVGLRNISCMFSTHSNQRLTSLLIRSGTIAPGTMYTEMWVNSLHCTCSWGGRISLSEDCLFIILYLQPQLWCRHTSK